MPPEADGAWQDPQPTIARLRDAGPAGTFADTTVLTLPPPAVAPETHNVDDFQRPQTPLPAPEPQVLPDPPVTSDSRSVADFLAEIQETADVHTAELETLSDVMPVANEATDEPVTEATPPAVEPAGVAIGEPLVVARPPAAEPVNEGAKVLSVSDALSGGAPTLTFLKFEPPARPSASVPDPTPEPVAVEPVAVQPVVSENALSAGEAETTVIRLEDPETVPVGAPPAVEVGPMAPPPRPTSRWARSLSSVPAPRPETPVPAEPPSVVVVDSAPEEAPTKRRTWASSLGNTRPRPVVSLPPRAPSPPQPAATEASPPPIEASESPLQPVAATAQPRIEPEALVEPVAKPQADPVTEPETIPEPEALALPEARPEAASIPEPQPEAATIPEPQPETKPEPPKAEHNRPPDPPQTPPPPAAQRPPSAPPPVTRERKDEPRPAPAPGRRRKVALGALLVVLGLVILPIAGLLLVHVSNVQRQFSQLRADGIHAEGTLANGGPGASNQITFTDRGGRVITRTMGAPNGNDVLPDGKVDVVYVPTNPGNAALAHEVTSSNHVDAALLVGSGLGAVAGLALIFWGVVLLTGSRPPIGEGIEAHAARAVPSTTN